MKQLQSGEDIRRTLPPPNERFVVSINHIGVAVRIAGRKAKRRLAWDELLRLCGEKR